MELHQISLVLGCIAFSLRVDIHRNALVHILDRGENRLQVVQRNLRKPGNLFPPGALLFFGAFPLRVGDSLSRHFRIRIGFGQTGVKEYVERPAYDVVVQAYCGIMNLTGFPDRDPVKAERNPTDYFNALTAYGSSLAAYVGAQRTGRGESIDLAQYESALATQGDALAYWLNEKVQLPRRGSTHESISGSGTICSFREDASPHSLSASLSDITLRRMFIPDIVSSAMTRYRKTR